MKIDIEVVENGVVVSYRDLISTKTEVFELDGYEKIEKFLKFLYQKINHEYKIGEYVRILNNKSRGLDTDIDLIRQQAYTEGFEFGWQKGVSLADAALNGDTSEVKYIVAENEKHLSSLKDELHEMVNKTLERKNQ